MTDCIDLIYPYIDGFLEILIEFGFLHVYLQKRGSLCQLALFILGGSILVSLPLPVLPKLFLFAALLFLYTVRIQKITVPSAVIFTLLTITIMQLSYGMLNSVSTVSASFFYRLRLPLPGRLFMIATSLLSLTLAILCYRFVYTKKRAENAIRNRQCLLILVPLLTIFAISIYISFTFYGNTASPAPLSTPLIRSQSQMLLIQLLSVISIFSILHICHNLEETSSLHEKMTLLTRQFRFQKQYAEKAQAHYEETKALRHDMKNHILIVKGLLEKENFKKARIYLEKLDAVSAGLSFSFHTGSPVIDILLENKTALARSRGISVSNSLALSFPCAIDDMDFCIILSNALDNAIHACEKLDKRQKRHIHLDACRQESLLLLEIHNSCQPNLRFSCGIGLSNIRKAAEKYDGTVTIHIKNGTFYLSILLVIPQHPENISHQIDS